jgi:hypothetical protein|tara:strand:- start:40 stop:291 length:252 start_codon:yes stop_codon:yes gene_type:complete
MNKIFIIILVIVLSGCAARMNSSNKDEVNISNTHMFNLRNAVSMADKECSKYGKKASLGVVVNDVYIPKADVGIGYVKFYCYE